MTERLATTGFGGRERVTGGASIELRLEILGEDLCARLPVADEPLGLGDLVPMARGIADEIVSRTVQRAASAGQPVSCRKGCGACCHYLVPLSAPEAYRLRDDIDSLPRSRRKRVTGRFADAARRVLQSRPPADGVSLPGRGTETDGAASERISSWYSGLELPCPFLADNVCTFYPSRPIACREHFVLTPPPCCADGQGDTGVRLETPLSVSEALARVAGEVEGTSLEAVPMTVALEWCRLDPRRTQRRWPGPMLVERLATTLRNLADEAAAGASTAA